MVKRFMCCQMQQHINTKREIVVQFRTYGNALLLRDDVYYAFSTWLKSSSTGVARPKIETDTFRRLFS